MRSYGSVPTNFWETPEIRQLSDQAKLMAIYLMTGPHSNMLGCFRLPDVYVTEDLQWDMPTVKKSFDELINIKFINRDGLLYWLVVNDYLKSNKIQNSKQGICIQKLFSAVPEQSTIIEPLAVALLTYGRYLHRDFVEQLQSKVNGIDTLSHDGVIEQEQDYEQEKEQEQYQDQDQNQIQEQEKEMAVGCASAISKKSFSLSNINKKTKKQDDLSLYQSEAMEVLDFLNEHANKAYEPTREHLHHIRERLMDGADVQICRSVIVRKTRQWRGKESLEANLNPVTLFRRENFNRYKGELVLPKEEVNDAAR